MSDFLTTLIDRSLGLAPVLERRKPSLFEAPRGAKQPSPETSADLEADAPTPHATAAPSPSQPSAPRDEHAPPLRPAPESHTRNEIRAEIPAAPAPHPERLQYQHPLEPVAVQSDEGPRATPRIEHTLELETIVEREVVRTFHAAPAVAELSRQTSPPPSYKDAPAPSPAAPVRNEPRTPAKPQASPQAKFTIASHAPPLPRPTVPPAVTPRATRQRDATRAPEPPPAIHVSIGRIEVRAAESPTAPPRRTRAFAPKLSLDDYLASRTGGSK
jgi:hypothetical protein